MRYKNNLHNQYVALIKTEGGMENHADITELDALLNELNEIIYKYVGNNSETKIILQNSNNKKQLIIRIGTLSEMRIQFENE